MKRTAVRVVSSLAIGVAAISVGVGGSSQAADPGARGAIPGAESPARSDLRIMLTNDDGYAFAGIQALYRALQEEGYDVTIFAPLTNQSGKGATQTYGTLSVSRPVAGDPHVMAVSGTPSDTVALALEAVFKSAKPDLILSGCNKYENTGVFVQQSGTVGAAATALNYGVPAIACSSMGDYSDPTFGTPDYEGSARLMVGLVQYLDRHRDVLRTMRQTGLNFNYPFLSEGERLRGVKVAASEPVDNHHLAYTASPTDPDQYQVSFVEIPSANLDTDFSSLAQDWATLTPLDGTLFAPRSSTGFVDKLAAVLNRQYAGSTGFPSGG